MTPNWYHISTIRPCVEYSTLLTGQVISRGGGSYETIWIWGNEGVGSGLGGLFR